MGRIFMRHSLALRATSLLLTFCVLLQTVGCSAFQPKMQSVTIATVPTGAAITVNGQNMGKSPITVQLERNKDHAIVAQLGSKSAVRNLNSGFSKTGVLDLIGTFFFLVPGIGLLTPGAWELDESNVVIQLPQ
jgi:hypothetical protein